MAQEIKMSASGLKAMQDELEYLKTVRRKELAEEIKEARSHGDLSENSEYDEAKNTQGLVENRITELEQMVKNAVIIDESELSVDSVAVGTHVSIKMIGDDEAEEYDIVGRTEADPINGKISDESPVGHALLGKAAQDKARGVGLGVATHDHDVLAHFAKAGVKVLCGGGLADTALAVNSYLTHEIPSGFDVPALVALVPLCAETVPLD